MYYIKSLILNPFLNRFLRHLLVFLYHRSPSKKIRYFIKSISSKIPCVGAFNIKTSNGNNIRLISDEDDEVLAQLFWPWSSEEVETIMIYINLVESSNVIFDIGAYNGLYSIIAASINSNAVIHSFEPNPQTYKVLERNIYANDLSNININNLALSDSIGEVKFFIPSGSTLASDSSMVQGFRPNSREISVKSETIDSFTKKNNIHTIDLIKLDVESAEHIVLSGGLNQLINGRPIIICEVLYKRNEKELHNVLDKFNYNYYWNTDRGLIMSKEICGDKTYEFRNWFFVPEEKVHIIQNFAK